MTESPPNEKKDSKANSVVLKSVKIKRPSRVIRTQRTAPVISHDKPDAAGPTLISENVPSNSSPSETVSSDTNQPAKTALWKGALPPSQNKFTVFDRIFQPNIQYKLFLLFLSIWGASFIMFYLSTTFAIILPDPFNFVVLAFFLISTSLSGIYTFLLGLQHFRSTRRSSDNDYY